MDASVDSPACLTSPPVRLAATGDGPLKGHTFVVKDLIAIAGHVSSFGHARWRETHGPSEKTAPVVVRLLAAGAGMVGLAKLDQLAYSLIGNVGEGAPPLNSLYPDRFCGGSSSGSAAAVAGGVADFGIGTDTAGSIRVPAAACGLFSLRATHGLITVEGVLPLAPSLDVVGICARDSTVLANVFGTLVDLRTGSESPLRTVLTPTSGQMPIEGRVESVLARTAEAVASALGVPMNRADVAPLTSPHVADLFARIQGREIWANHSAWLLENRQHLAGDVRARLEGCEQAAAASREERAADEASRREYANELFNLVSADQLLVMPVIPDLMPLRTSSLREQKEFRARTVRLSAPSSLSGMPELVLPVHDRALGHTFGIGMLASRGSDHRLFQLAGKLCGRDGRLVLQ